MIYFDNAASSWPKPGQVLSAVQQAIEENSANPGRSGHRLAREAGMKVYQAREKLARLIGADAVERVIFTANATEALNVAMKGVLNGGDHVITTVMEHNSVLRPLRVLEKQGVLVDIVPCGVQGVIDPAEIKKRLRPQTRLIVMTHASNVTGIIQPVGEVGKIAEEAGVLFLVDAAQTLGAYPVNVKDLKIELLAMTGHKSLLGPQGTGALYVAPGAPVRPLKEGGTGSFSELEQQPGDYPDYLESGTLNGVGLAGLAAAVGFIEGTGLENMVAHEQQLVKRLVAQLREIKRVIIYGHTAGTQHVPVVSFNLKGCDPSEVSFILDRVYDIAVRPGLHCAPQAHKALGTFPQGTVRASLSYFNTIQEVDEFVAAIKEIAFDL